MSINSGAIRKAGPFSGNGSQTSFPFTFKVFQASDLYVVLTNPSGVETVQTLTSQYTVSLNANQDSNPGGSVVMVTAPASGYLLTLGSQVPETQPLVLTNTGGFYPTVINDALDRATIQIQQIEEKVSRSAKLPISSTADANTLSAAILQLANDQANIDAVAGGLTNINTVAGNTTNINTVATNNANVTAVGGNITNVNTVAGISGNVTSVAGNATNINTVAAANTNVNTVATNIASVNTAASNITAIQNASTNATNAANSATAAATSASNAATSASAASSSASAASSSASSALTYLNSFKGQYYGPLSTDPATDPLGNAPTAGDLYFNTSSNTLRTYTGTTWIDTGAAAPITITTQQFSGTGSQTVFTLTSPPAFQTACEVFIGGVAQVPGVDFTVSGSTLTFTSAPPAGTNNIFARWMSPIGAGVPNDNSVSTAKIQDGAVTAAKLAPGAVAGAPDFLLMAQGVI